MRRPLLDCNHKVEISQSFNNIFGECHCVRSDNSNISLTEVYIRQLEGIMIHVVSCKVSE